MTYEILLEIKEFIRKNYGKDLLRDSVVFRKWILRVYLDDGSFIDIRYANPQEYSLHQQGENKITRVDTAPFPQTVSLCIFLFHRDTVSSVHPAGSWAAVEANGTGLPSRPCPAGSERCSHRPLAMRVIGTTHYKRIARNGMMQNDAES